MNIDKDGGDIAFVTYEKGEAEAKVILDNVRCKIMLQLRFLCNNLQNEGKRVNHFVLFQLMPF